MTFTREQKVGFFFVGGVILFVGFIEFTVGTGLFKTGTRLSATFSDVQGLASGAQVRVSGVKVGRVERVELLPGHVRVSMLVDKDAPVHEDALARLDFQALSGTRFVAIDPGSPSAKKAADGATIRSEEPAGISQMVDELKNVGTSIRSLADSLNENQNRLLTTVNAMVEENREAITKTMTNLGAITEKLNSGQGTLGRLLVDSRLYDEAIAALASLRDSFGDVRKVTSRLAEGRGTLGHLLEDDGMYDDLRDTIASLHVTARNFEDVSEQVRRGEGTLGRLVSDDTLYDQAQGALQGVSRATQGIEDQAPISVLGTLIGTIF